MPDEALILDCANKALAERNCSPLRKISDLFAGAPRLVTTFPELDVARDSASIRVGPMTDQVESQTAEWVASQNRPRILAQLRGDTPGLQMLLQHLRAVNGDVICCILGGESAAFRNLRGIRVIAEPVTPGLLRDASAFVANGQTESVALAAKAGIPQVHVVFDAVGKMNAQLAAARGVAIPVVTKNARASFGESIRKAILDKRYRAAASQLAAKCINYDADEMIIRAAAIIINEIR
ncbi:MAG TPA: nucleotide disphospho-sugar-binding domain-containing protein [Steroidobacteraceae bacterium]|nr:nucleotide disphospho-sugar-binding domain-containing protein [Steroidobacteraceae bacterium]